MHENNHDNSVEIVDGRCDINIATLLYFFQFTNVIMN